MPVSVLQDSRQGIGVLLHLALGEQPDRATEENLPPCIDRIERPVVILLAVRFGEVLLIDQRIAQP